MNAKNIWILSFLFYFLPSSGYSQQGNSTTGKSIEISNVEKFSTQSGSLIQKEFIDIGSVKGCKIQISNFADLITNEKTTGVRLEYMSSNGYSIDTKSAFLDTDEIDGLMKSLIIIQEKILPSSPENYTEVSYKSRDGFEAGCYRSKNNWSAYLQLKPHDSKSIVFMNKDDLGKLLSYLKSIKEKL